MAAKAELKTKKTTKSVAAFIAEIKDPQVRADCKAIDAMMRRATGEKPVMWGSAIIGYGNYRYKYASGREGDWMEAAFSPRKQNLTVYVMTGFSKFGALLKKLGPHKISKACLYIKRLSDVDTEVLEKIIRTSVELIRSGKVKLGN
jgi:hypothetical protein